MGLNDKADAAMRRELAKAFPERAANDPGHDRLAEALSKPETDAEALSRLLRESDETTRLVESVSKPTHTPGPWMVHHEPSLNRFAVRAEPFGTKTILSVSYWERTLPWDREHAEANARLIAAAPDLLEACKALVEYRDIIKQNYPDLPGLIRGMEAARVAIARATGGAK